MKHSIFKSFLRDLETHKKDQDLSTEQQYHITCWKTCQAVFTALDKLEIAKECIKHAYKYAPKEHLVPDYIEYHIENYLIRSRSVYDRVLIFTNSLCDIGKSKEQVKHKLIIGHPKVKSCGLVKLIEAINEECNTYREVRNGVVHHDKYQNNELAWVHAAVKAKYILDGEIEKIGITTENINANIMNIISLHVSDFDKNTMMINQLISVFLDSANSIYDSHIEQKYK
ncbi:Cthe_2314 family HEPN domain-containing protein [Pseudoalteromonas sp. SWXJZ10B]|uniref:Cthe_2314 family HEPN domain-containing protein n=1 Tax=Pseudoalteromonas sp. SWXJZ10B TaxID=2792063 RepID=UPI0018CE7BB2|nr:Cthe_2314 family HEPN domain-containing protein [Pseudoalteromonas sp. SWXJZ10B]MBH0041430.1 hypothetical protein [Pseudoalteromonas sp. SWXJZ10B]